MSQQSFVFFPIIIFVITSKEMGLLIFGVEKKKKNVHNIMFI